MAGSPRYKVHDPEGKYQASCKEPEAASHLCGFYGRGSTVKVDSKIVYRADGEADSHDEAAAMIYAAERQHRLVAWQKRYPNTEPPVGVR